MDNTTNFKAGFHLPGMFAFWKLYKRFLPIFKEHRDFFYDGFEICSIYDAPLGCIWGGGRVGTGEEDAREVIKFLNEYGISARLTFSNSLLGPEHLKDRQCNELCELLAGESGTTNSVIVHSDLLLQYLRERYPELIYVSSTTKVITDFELFKEELDREEFDYVVPDFRLNRQFERLKELTGKQKKKVEFLCNECCYFGCTERKQCYEDVSSKILGEDKPEHICHAPGAEKGYTFSGAMKNPGFIGVDDIKNIYIPMGFNNFKIEGRELGSALILEFLLYYLTKPEYQLEVREMIYLDSCLDLF